MQEIKNEIKINELESVNNARDKEIEYLAIDDLTPYEKNARTHDEYQIEKLKNSLKEFGFINPVIIDENNMILVGHGRIMGAKELGIETVPCIRIKYLTDDQKKAYILADNKLSDLGGWDLDLLNEELISIDLDMSMFGFDEIELDDIEDTEIVEDEVPDVPDEPKAKIGDIYQLGNHRLMCGDSTSEEDVAKLMNGVKADMVFTDPPYGMNLDTDYSKMPGTSTHYKKVIGDDKEFDMTKIFKNIKSPIWYVWGADYLYKTIPNFDDGVYIVWSKRMSDEENKVFGSAYELCWTYPKRKKEIWFVRGINQSSERLGEHPTQKPTELCIRALKQNDNANIVVDVFGGSGSTLIACEQLNRKCYMMELDPHYIDVIIQRWENFTGKKAVKIN